MDIPAEKIIERYAQALADAQQQLFITQAALAAYEEAEKPTQAPVEANV